MMVRASATSVIGLIAEHIDEVVEPPARVHEIGRLAFEAIEEPLFARNEPDHARVPQSVYRRRSAAAVSEHGAPGRRPNIHAHFVGRQGEDGLDTLPARVAEANRSTLIADIPFPAPENVAAKRCASEKRAF